VLAGCISLSKHEEFIILTIVIPAFTLTLTIVLGTHVIIQCIGPLISSFGFGFGFGVRVRVEVKVRGNAADRQGSKGTMGVESMGAGMGMGIVMCTL